MRPYYVSLFNKPTRLFCLYTDTGDAQQPSSLTTPSKKTMLGLSKSTNKEKSTSSSSLQKEI
jgi:hypothetical protein